MKIGLIGYGRMAQAMGAYFKDHGYPVCGLWGRDPGKSQDACTYLGVRQYGDLAELVMAADALMLAVADDSIATVGAALADTGNVLTGKWVFHLSGSLSLEVLEPMIRQGAKGFTLHPLQTVPDRESGRRDLKRATLMMEADESFREPLEEWLSACGNTLAWIIPGKKALYHLGACLASNYVMTLYHLAEEALIESGISKEIASTALLPLMETTLNNYQQSGALHSLTGPVSRGDAGTVRKHLESLRTAGWEQRAPLIKGLGLEALAIARESGTVTDEKAQIMEQILKGGCTE